MGRPEKTGLDYYSMTVNIHDDERMVEAMHEFGNHALGMLTRLLGRLHDQWGYFHPWTEKDQKRAVAKMGEPLEVLSRFVACLLADKYFDPGMFERHSVLTSADTQKNFVRAVEKRTNVRVYAAYWLLKPGEFNAKIAVVAGFPGEETPPDGGARFLPDTERLVEVGLSGPESPCIRSDQTKPNEREIARASLGISSSGNQEGEEVSGTGQDPVIEYAVGICIRQSTYVALQAKFSVKPTDLLREMQRISVYLANAKRERPTDMDAYVESWMYRCDDFKVARAATVHPFPSPTGSGARADVEFLAVMDVVREYRGPRFEETRAKLSGEARKTAETIGWHVLAATNRHDTSMQKRFVKVYGEVLTRHQEPVRAEG